MPAAFDRGGSLVWEMRVDDGDFSLFLLVCAHEGADRFYPTSSFLFLSFVNQRIILPLITFALSPDSLLKTYLSSRQDVLSIFPTSFCTPRSPGLISFRNLFDLS